MASQNDDSSSSSNMLALIDETSKLISSQHSGIHQELTKLEKREGMIRQLREDQVTHYHSTVWTKDAHGGAYRKVARKEDPSSASIQRSLVLGSKPTSTDLIRPEDLLGYERVDIGPTTNFVGNHMTQGAIDLVQAELLGMADEQKEEETLLLKPVRRPAGILSALRGRRRRLLQGDHTHSTHLSGEGVTADPDTHSNQCDEGELEAALINQRHDQLTNGQGQGLMDLQVLRRQARVLLLNIKTSTRAAPTRLA
ncbi:hypothetical protein CEUSTIGMA_g12140.t1 [Chlamydomonas eustigma]|uniref:Uncharacterized protein n=1 Tax=Chlamydomonas eustigma TaxID=1157962 RepID=A0A250XNS0_9CHLO|nr:hypothetical protein CEUSTIGMA_g12140.t1 [Chlamydomonas eustigma]|eukprot:GAX84718.1 hypothetical protein CEUSTIGMA_g12140.t1 [Chlamydomonas eustigma]